MNNSKRILSLALVLLMLLALTACGKKQPDLTGTWVTEIDMAPLIANEMDKELAVSNLGVEADSFADYLDTLPCRIHMELKQDGTFLQSLDDASLSSAQGKLLDSMLNFCHDLLRNALIVSLQNYGIIGEGATDEDVETTLGMSMEDAIQMAFGADMESYIHSILDGLWNSLAEEFKQEGQYKAEEGKLFLSDSLEHNVDSKVYYPFTLENGVLTLEAVVGGADSSELDTFFPLVFRAG